MIAQQNTRKTGVGATALVAATFGLGALVLQQSVESQDANAAKAGVAKLESTDDSVFANSLRKTQENARTRILAGAHDSS